MTQESIILIVVGAIVAAALVWIGLALRRSYALRRRFGPEYVRVVETVGDKRKAEAELDARMRRVEKLQLKPLSDSQLGHYHDVWQSVQARFVEDPKQAVAEADQLVSEVMNVRGYPVGDFEQRAADVSVDHPQVVTHYRAAHAVAVRSDQDANTEDLRQAVIHYRALFEDLLETREPVGV
jgi:hypothetical protein